MKAEMFSTSNLIVFVRFISLGLNFLFNTFIAKYLGASESSLFFYSLSVINLLCVFSRFGIDTLSLKERSENDKVNIFVPFFYVSLISTSFFTIIIFSLSNYLSELFAIHEIKVLVLSILPVNMITLLAQFNIAADRKVVGTLLLTLVTNLLCFFILLLINFDTVTLIYVYTLSCFMSFVISFLLSYKTINIELKIKVSILRDMFRRSRDFYFSSLLSAFIIFLPIFYIEYFSKPEEVSWYTLSTRISAACAVFLTAMNSYYSPEIVKCYIKKDLELLHSNYQRVTKSLSLTMLPFILICSVVSFYYFEYLGDDFSGAFYVLLVLLIAQVVNSLVGFAGTVLNMTGHENVQRNNIFLSFTVIAIVSPLLITYYGALGAAFTFTLANILGNLKSFFYMRKVIF